MGSTTWTVDILNEPFPGGQLLTLDIDGTFDSTTDIATFSGTGSFGALGMTISDGEGVFLASDQVYFSETVSIGNPVRGWVAKQLLRIGAGGIIDWILEKDEKKQTLPKTYNLSNIVNSNITINQNSGGVTVTTTVKADKYGKTTVKTSSTPEPCSLIIWGIGTLGIVGYRWRRRKLFRNDPFRES